VELFVILLEANPFPSNQRIHKDTWQLLHGNPFAYAIKYTAVKTKEEAQGPKVLRIQILWSCTNRPASPIGPDGLLAFRRVLCVAAWSVGCFSAILGQSNEGASDVPCVWFSLLLACSMDCGCDVFCCSQQAAGVRCPKNLAFFIISISTVPTTNNTTTPSYFQTK
jgi:hypothetical protein